MDKTQLPQDFGRFHTFFTEDFIGSNEGVKMLYMPPKNAQKSTAPRFWTFLNFFSKNCIGSSEMPFMPKKFDKTQLPQDIELFPTFFAKDYVEVKSVEA